MIRRRGHEHQNEESSSDDEEDAFSALSKKANTKKKAKHSSSCNTSGQLLPHNNAAKAATTSNSINFTAAAPDGSKKSSSAPTTSRESSSSVNSQRQPQQRVPKLSVTSSMKRHHKPSDSRKAKMDALIQELEAEKDQIPKKTRRFVPDKKGSFVNPGEEHLTTNIFVGNLAPSIAEEDLSNLFSQFGELYSVKIMWPRTTEEKNRRRNTGFVCFMNRDDAEEALEACDETDPFNNGRLLTLRWGKSVKKIQRRNNTDTGLAAKPSATQNRQNNNHAEKFTKKACIDDDSSTGALPPTDAGVTTSNRKESLATSDDPTTHDGFGKQQQTPGMKSTPPEVPPYDPEMHASRAIRVETPKDLSRFHFISTTASYVAKDPELEQRFRDEEKGNPLFCFLDTFGSDDRNDKDRKEKLFYRWRVYSFCQGDTYSIWRTEPFLMFHGGGYWIPPPLDADAVEREKTNAAEKEYRQRQQKEDRANRELMTGRQFERRKRRGDFGANQSQLNPEELRRFDQLVRKQLSISRKTICEAMSFCFDNCVAAREVSGLLQEALLEDSDHVTNDTRIARLYLLSDILFNSQQPGVRNAFMYRTTIESMAVDIFENLGNIVRSKERSSGRITVNKLRKAVSAVLGAWTEWGVYNATFVDDLEASFEGREVKHDANTKVEKDLDLGDNEEKCEEQGIYEDAEDVVIDGPRGDWKEVSDEASPSKDKKKKTRVAINITAKQPSKDTNGKSIPIGSSNCEPQNLMVDDRGGEKESDGSKASVNIDEELDGEELDGEELDGEEIDGEDLYGEVLDGEELDA